MRLRRAVQFDDAVQLPYGVGEPSFDLARGWPLLGILGQHLPHDREHGFYGPENRIPALLRVVVQERDPRVYLPEVPVEVEGGVRDAAPAACGSVFGTAVVDEGRELALAEMREDVEDDRGKGEYVRGLSVELVGLPRLDHRRMW